MLILIGFHPFLLMQFLCRCWHKAFATAAFMQIVSHILHEHLSPKKAQNEHARQCPPYEISITTNLCKCDRYLSGLWIDIVRQIW